jgi:hypothetical protein
MLAELPRHYIQPKTVWNDMKGRTLVCWAIWDVNNDYSIEFLVLGGSKPLGICTASLEGDIYPYPGWKITAC